MCKRKLYAVVCTSPFYCQGQSNHHLITTSVLIGAVTLTMVHLVPIVRPMLSAKLVDEERGTCC